MAISPARADDVCDPATRTMIESRFDTTWADDQLDVATLRRLLPGRDAVITSWGTPPLPTDLLGADAGGPTVVGHAAGTIKKLLDGEGLARVTTFSAAPRIAWSVGEYCLSALLTLLRRLPAYDAGIRSGGWKPVAGPGREPLLRGLELRGSRIGIVGASSTARAFIELLRPFGVEMLVHDPYLDPARADALGVRPASLSEVMACAVLSIHVPATPETEGMITAELLDRLPDGGIVINSSRAAAVDNEALIAAADSGRLRVALDVYPTEPPDLAPEVLQNPNLLLTPHIAGDTGNGHQALVRYVLDDMIAFLDSGTTHGPSWVDPANLAITA
ncbi:Phosphoglycerate dehydrogenase [Microlunatus soli]|uniref:Phosphoglycerate dehydrogenase n=2 Tax=Microlunatus soli TaxID=630515 RepID=A0A1H1ZQA5_9ACTN|nr:Phosphoglycerate dehydrogenase [Microlunatus soli]